MSLGRSCPRRLPTCALVCLCLLGPFIAPTLAELPESRRVNSVKSLTHILSLIEEDNGDAARFTTMKLQIHLEDVYISQGTAVVLRPVDLSTAIAALLKEGKKRSEAARIILHRYQDGEFHES